jgi:molecular chaperone IbpA
MTNTRRINPYYIGFDSIFDKLFHEVDSKIKTVTYPPHDIVKIDDKNYRVDVAVAGFSEEEVSVTLERDVLTISGKRQEPNEKSEYVFRGIAKRDFDLKFNLYNKFLKVDNAVMKDGILSIQFVSVVPEDQLPKQITIQKS